MAGRRKGKDSMDNSSKRSYDTWTCDEDNKMLDLLIEQVNMGNKLPNGVWKHEVFNNCISMFNLDAPNQKTVEQLKNRVRTWKKMYLVVSTCLNTSGFGWDATTQKVTASKTVWQDYIKMHREDDKYRREGCPLYEKLAIVVGNSIAAGKGSNTSNDADDNLSNMVERTMIEDIDEDDAIREIPSFNESQSDAPPKNKAPSNDDGDITSSSRRRKRSEPLVQNANKIVEAIDNMSSTLKEIFSPPVEPQWFEAIEALPNLPREVKYFAMELLGTTKSKQSMFMKMKPEDQYDWLMTKFNAM